MAGDLPPMTIYRWHIVVDSGEGTLLFYGVLMRM